MRLHLREGHVNLLYVRESITHPGGVTRLASCLPETKKSKSVGISTRRDKDQKDVMVSNISDAEYKSQEFFSRFFGGAVQHRDLTYRWPRLHRPRILILCTARRLKCSMRAQPQGNLLLSVIRKLHRLPRLTRRRAHDGNRIFAPGAGADFDFKIEVVHGGHTFLRSYCFFRFDFLGQLLILRQDFRFFQGFGKLRQPVFDKGFVEFAELFEQ